MSITNQDHVDALFFSMVVKGDIDSDCHHDNKSFTSKIQNFQQTLGQLEQLDIPVVHHFAPGVYLREMHAPAGATIIGKTHRYDHACILSKGRVTVVSEHGTETLEAPYTFTAKAGAKRAFYVHEDIVWTTVHPTQTTDLEAIERDVIVPDEDVIAFRKSLLLEN